MTKTSFADRGWSSSLLPIMGINDFLLTFLKAGLFSISPTWANEGGLANFISLLLELLWLLILCHDTYFGCVFDVLELAAPFFLFKPWTILDFCFLFLCYMTLSTTSLSFCWLCSVSFSLAVKAAILEDWPYPLSPANFYRFITGNC